jgi:ubiquinone/menaquinone biosynthesis C-methylase UbiE
MWSEPEKTFNEIWRVLKKGGKIFISDLRRDMFFPIRWFLWINTKPKEIRPGLITSINAAYTPDELRKLIKGTKLENCVVSYNPFGLKVVGLRECDRESTDKTIPASLCVNSNTSLRW